MQLIKKISRVTNALGRKISSDNVSRLGQKLMNTGRMIGRKAVNSINRIEGFATKALPIAQNVATALGYPEVKMLNMARQGVDQLSNVKNKLLGQ